MPSEYENVSFDGSWVNAFFLADPTIVASLTPSRTPAPVAGAQWHEQARDGMTQKVL